MDKHLVFTYGTLKQGFHNHHCLQGAILKASAIKTKYPNYSMVALFSRSQVGKLAPGVQKREIGSFIEGEIYEVSPSMLENLDILEENGSRYQRDLTTISNGTEAWLYFHTFLEEPTADLSETNQISFDHDSNCYNWILPTE